MAGMTLQVGIEHVRDGFDCQLAAEKSLKSVRRAFPVSRQVSKRRCRKWMR